jgi:hypothetical protein
MQNDVLRDELLRNSKAEYERLSWDGSANKLLDIYHSHKELALV